MKTKISIIAAVSSNGVIGMNGIIPWYIPSDLKRFKRLTKGKPIIMGRKTCESIGKPLPKRRNIVITRNSQFEAPGCEIVGSLEEAFQLVSDSEEVFVIGGNAIYQEAIELADCLHITYVKTECKGDTYFINIDREIWEIESEEEVFEKGDGFETVYTVYRRKKKFVIDAHARNNEQKEIHAQIKKDGVCPFCPEHLVKYHDNPILKEGNYWLVTENQWPYKGVEKQLLVIYKQHAEKLSDIESTAGQELIEIVTWAEKEFSIPSGSLIMRFGNPEYNGGSVSHLHFHLIQGTISREKGLSIRVKVGYMKKE